MTGTAWWFLVISQHIIKYTAFLALSPLSIVGSIQNRDVDRSRMLRNGNFVVACHGRAGHGIFSFPSPAIEVMQHFGPELSSSIVRSDKWHELNRLNCSRDTFVYM